MLRWIAIVILGMNLLWLAACTSTPPAPSKPLPPAQIQKLQQMRLPTKLPVPVDDIKAKNLKDTWGASRSSGRTHEGIDILAPRGTKVYTATEGLIADLRNNNLGGKVVWIIGPAGSWHYYAHLDDHKRGLKVGDYVKKGDLIGYVGNTGNSFGNHCHFEMSYNGALFSAYTLFSGM